MGPLINILIRTSSRPISFARCIASVQAQTYKNVRVIVSYDNLESLGYIPADYERMFVEPTGAEYDYNLYCNQLKSMVTEGWFFFLDDDDALAGPTALEELAPFLTGNGVIVQMNRSGRLKPATAEIKCGDIGMPCLVLPAMNARLALVTATYDGDYQWIKSVAERVPLQFHPIVLVKSRWRGHGHRE